MCRLFHLVVRPLATVKTQEAFLGELRIMAIDGSVFDLPDIVIPIKNETISTAQI